MLLLAGEGSLGSISTAFDGVVWKTANIRCIMHFGVVIRLPISVYLDHLLQGGGVRRAAYEATRERLGDRR